MKRIFLIALLSLTNAYAANTVATIEYTPGIDEGTNLLLPGSDWTLEVTSSYNMNCADINPNLEFYKTKLVPVTSYVDREVECKDADHVGYGSETYIDWQEAGFHQTQEFGLEEITCPVYGNCEMQRVVNTENKYVDSIRLQSGENGTKNGAGKVFVTKLDSYQISSIPGQGGKGGVNDLNFIEPETRYCAKIQDAVQNNPTPESSKVPYATVHIYKWLPFDISLDGGHGINAPKGNRVEIYKGLSPTAIHRLKDLYFN